MLKKILCVALSLAMVLSMAACGGDTKETEAAGTTAAAGETAAPAQTGGQKESCVTIGVSGTPDLDPAIATTGSSIIAVINMYDTLVFPEGDGVVGRIAESWEQDGRTYTFKLKQGIKFHNGEELKASDVKFSMDRLLTIGEGYAYIFADAVDSTEVVDDYTVKFNLKTDFGPFVNALCRLAIVSEKEVMDNLAEGPYGEFGDYGKNYLITNDAGSGAYCAKELVQQDYFYAEKNPDWFVGWDNEYAPEAFKMMAITEATTVRTMMNNRELDITDQWQSAETLAALDKVDGIDIGCFSTYLVYNMYMNTQLAPLDDVNFRRAIASIIDYETICNDIFLQSEMSQGPVASGVAGSVPTNLCTYDLEKAKEYLAASKYADTYGDYEIEIMVNSDVADLEKVALMIQADAAKIGINIVLSRAPWVSMVDRMGAQETTPHMTAINAAPGYNEAGAFLESHYHSKTMGTWEQGEWLGNATVDSMIEDALATPDQAERYAKYADIQNYIIDELYPTAYLCDLTERVAYQSAYITWPALESAGDGIASALYGYLHVFADMELHLENK